MHLPSSRTSNIGFTGIDLQRRSYRVLRNFYRAFKEFTQIIKETEKHLIELFQYDKINYLMLMMVDPNVHFHIIPRYATNRIFHSFEFQDFGWPALPKIAELNYPSREIFDILLSVIKHSFKNRPVL